MSKKEDIEKEYRKLDAKGLIDREEQVQFYKDTVKTDREYAIWELHLEIIEKILKDRGNGV